MFFIYFAIVFSFFYKQILNSDYKLIVSDSFVNFKIHLFFRLKKDFYPVIIRLNNFICRRQMFSIIYNRKFYSVFKVEQMKRKIIKIDEDKCDGCGVCVPECHEGALQVIDGKVRLISDLFCDGLGACIGHCPQDALVIEEREAEPYDETKVMDYIVKGGLNVIKAHLEHLRDHEEFEYLKEAFIYLKRKGITNPIDNVKPSTPKHHQGCPGSTSRVIKKKNIETDETGKRQSQLTQWPIQLHLVPPTAPYYRDSNLLLAAIVTPSARPRGMIVTL